MKKMKDEKERWKRWKRKMLDDEIKRILEKLDVDLTTLELGCKFCEKPHDFEEERELRLSAKERINEIKSLKEEAENIKDIL